MNQKWMFLFLVAIGASASILFSLVPWNYYVTCFQNGMIPDITSKEPTCKEISTPRAFGDQNMLFEIQYKKIVFGFD